MPANMKSFEKVKRTDFELLVQNLRSRGFATPYSDSGMLRASNRGLLADVQFEEKAELLNIRIRQVSKGETYDSIFNMLEETIKSTNR